MLNNEWQNFWNSGKIDDYLKYKQSENCNFNSNREVQTGENKGTCNQRANSWGEGPFSYSPYC